MFSRIEDALAALARSEGENSDPAAAYRRALLASLEENGVHPNPRERIAAPRLDPRLDPPEIARVHRGVLTDVATRVFADGILSEEDLEGVARLAWALDVAWEALPPPQPLPIEIAGALIGIGHGRLPVLAPSPDFHLGRGEVVHARIPCRLFERPPAPPASFPIVEGVPYRPGGIRGRTLPVADIASADTGVLTITNERLVFASERRNVAAPWSKVRGADPSANGIRLGLANRRDPVLLKYDDPTYAEVLAALVGRYVAWRVGA